MSVQETAAVLAAAFLAIGLVQSVRTRTCRIDRKPQLTKIAVWAASGIAITAATGAPLVWTVPVLAAALVAASLIVTVLTRAAWRLGL